MLNIFMTEENLSLCNMSCLLCFECQVRFCSSESLETSVNQSLLALRHLRGKQMESKPVWHVLISLSEWWCALLCTDIVFCRHSRFLNPLATSVLGFSFECIIYHFPRRCISQPMQNGSVHQCLAFFLLCFDQQRCVHLHSHQPKHSNTNL